MLGPITNTRKETNMPDHGHSEPLWGYYRFDFLRAFARLAAFPFVSAAALLS